MSGPANIEASRPYDAERRGLYTAAELFAGFDPTDPSSRRLCLDARVAEHLDRTGRIVCSPEEDMSRTMHDFHIRRAMRDFLDTIEMRRVIGVMGGHGIRRDDPVFRQVVLASKAMTERGELMISGGGPGAMEATHLGAWLAGRTDAEVEQAVSMLASVPESGDDRWLPSAYEVMERFPQDKGFRSLSIPTWYFGFEPPTPFATAIAKMFSNALREDTLLTEAYGGLVVVPGGPGTLQEVFQEAVQEHYEVLPFPSPMVFVGRGFWTKEVPVYPLVEKLQRQGFYKNLEISLVDSPDEIISALCASH